MNDAVQDRKDRKPSPWAQVADAGFSAVLERRGFERIGKALWRLQGDRVVWHYGLYRGVGAIPGSFRDNGGVLVPEHDEFFRREFGRGSAYKLDGLQQFAHKPFNMHYCWYRSAANQPDIDKLAPESLKERLAAALGLRKRTSAGGQPLPPFSSHRVTRRTGYCWEIGTSSFSEVALALGQLWDDFFWPEVEDMSSISGVRKRVWSREDRQDFIGNILAAALDNDRDEVMASVARLREQAERPVERFLEDESTRRYFERNSIAAGDPKRTEIAKNLREEVARLLGLAIDIAARFEPDGTSVAGTVSPSHTPSRVETVPGVKP